MNAVAAGPVGAVCEAPDEQRHVARCARDLRDRGLRLPASRHRHSAPDFARDPHFIGCDAGSTDPGPGPPGIGRTAFPRRAISVTCD